MEYRRLGKSGLPVSALSYGSWVTFSHQLNVDKALETMTAAYDAGVNFFDNAEVYATGQSETIMGEALQKVGWRRDSYIVSSKVMWGSVEDPKPTQRGLHRKHVFEACHDALRRLRVEYLDLYFCHRPDPNTPVSETVWTMHQLIMQGKVMYWGTSEWSAAEIKEAHAVAEKHHLIAPVMEQPQYNLFHRNRVELELSPLCKEYGLGLTTFSPLYQGVLTGKYNQGIPEGSRASMDSMAWMRNRITPENIEIVRKLTDVAIDLGITPSQLAIAWILRRKEVSSVITGATRAEQLDENLGAAEATEKLTDDILESIEQILGNHPE